MGARFARVVLVLAAAALVAGALTGCCGLLTASKSAKPAAATGAKADPTLEQYFNADAKHGTFTLTSLDEKGKVTFEATGTLWVDGRKFRYSIWSKGVHIRDIMSPDGKTAYFVQEKEKVSEPSVASVDRYLLEYMKPGPSAKEDGIDKATGATRMVYTIKKLDNLAGAANAWYTEDLTYLVKDGKVIGAVSRGDTPNKDGSPYDLSTSRRIFTSLEVGGTFPDDTFVLPYPIKKAK